MEGNKNLVLTTDKITSTLAVSKTTATCSLKTLEQFGIIKRGRGKITLCEPPKSWLEKTVSINTDLDTVQRTDLDTVQNPVLISRALGGGKETIPSPPKGEGIISLSRDTIPKPLDLREKTLDLPKNRAGEKEEKKGNPAKAVFTSISPKICAELGYMRVWKMCTSGYTKEQIVSLSKFSEDA